MVPWARFVRTALHIEERLEHGTEWEWYGLVWKHFKKAGTRPHEKVRTEECRDTKNAKNEIYDPMCHGISKYMIWVHATAVQRML